MTLPKATPFENCSAASGWMLTKSRKPKDRKRNYLNGFFLTLALLVFWSLRYLHNLPEGVFFLFQTDKSYINDHQPSFSRSDLWDMYEGAWACIGMLAYGALMIFCAWKYLSIPKKAVEISLSDLN